MSSDNEQSLRRSPYQRLGDMGARSVAGGIAAIALKEKFDAGVVLDIPSLGMKFSKIGTLRYKADDFNKRWSAIKTRERQLHETK